jgi:hypothetical protein
MSTLSMFPLPLPPNGPPVGYAWEEHGVSQSLGSTITACGQELDKQVGAARKPRCVICGLSARNVLERCYIIKGSEPDTVS